MKWSKWVAGIGVLLWLHWPLGAEMNRQNAPLITRIDGPVSIPAEISSHTLFVNVSINGHGPFRFMVDTGCSFTLLSPEVAEAVGAIVPDTDDDAILARNGLGNITDVTQVILGTVTLGAANFEGVPAAVSDSFEKLSLTGGGHVDGALGFPIFSDLFLGLDFPNRRVLLSSRWPEAMPPIRATLPVIENADVPFVQAQIQGIPVSLMIDTGANQSLQISTGLVSSLQWKETPRTGSLVAVLGEVGREGIGRLAGSLTLGEVREIEPVAVISPGLSSMGVRSLEQFCVIFHRSTNEVWLCSDSTAPISPKPERSAGLSLYADPGGWRIAGVIPGSPAAAERLTAGSLITQIENKPAATWTRDQIQQWIESHPVIALVIAEASGDRALSLNAWDLVP